MENKTWTHIDKSAWGAGAWQNEPDKEQWTDAATGLPCLIVRASHGALCGYVGVDAQHPFFGKDYYAPDVEIHGGLTFCGFCQEETETGICHIPGEGEPEKIWWFGFDCAHGGDLCPAFAFKYPNYHANDQYRDLEFVKNECRDLARQLSELRA